MIHMFWTSVRIASLLLELPQCGNSNKYPKHKFCKEIRTKYDLSYILICSLSILYNSKLILMATSLGTNAVVMRVHYLLGL